MKDAWNVNLSSVSLIYQSVRFNAPVNHIRFIHSQDPNFSLKCGIGSCEKVYKKLDSILQHYRRIHSSQATENVWNNISAGSETDIDLHIVDDINVDINV